MKEPPSHPLTRKHSHAHATHTHTTHTHIFYIGLLIKHCVNPNQAAGHIVMTSMRKGASSALHSPRTSNSLGFISSCVKKTSPFKSPFPTCPIVPADMVVPRTLETSSPLELMISWLISVVGLNRA